MGTTLDRMLGGGSQMATPMSEPDMQVETSMEESDWWGEEYICSPGMIFFALLFFLVIVYICHIWSRRVAA